MQVPMDRPFEHNPKTLVYFVEILRQWRHLLEGLINWKLQGVILHHMKTIRRENILHHMLALLRGGFLQFEGNITQLRDKIVVGKIDLKVITTWHICSVSEYSLLNNFLELK